MEALVQLAEPRAIPELCEVLPDIRSLAGDGNQDIHTRRALKQAAARIYRLVEEVRSLPIAAVAPPPSADVLPVVAHSPRGEPDHLPLPGADPGD
jgi:hypothetical protein